jgi:hypothetical protein
MENRNIMGAVYSVSFVTWWKTVTMASVYDIAFSAILSAIFGFFAAKITAKAWQLFTEKIWKKWKF